MLKQFSLQLREAGAAGWFENLNLNFTAGGPAIVTT